MQIIKGHFYLDTDGSVVQIISGRLEPLKCWVALVDPITPDIINVIFLDDTGYEIPHGDTILDGDITCTRCNGRGEMLIWNGPDDFTSQPCLECQGIGFKLTHQ